MKCFNVTFNIHANNHANILMKYSKVHKYSFLLLFILILVHKIKILEIVPSI